MREKLGFEPYPGTLNLRFRGRALDLLLSHGDPCEPVWIEPQPGFCAARCYPAVVGGRVVGAVVVPEIGDYPEDVAEVVAPVCIRDALGLQDGDRVSLRVGVAAVTGRRAPGGTGAGDGHRPGAPGVPAR
jgi:CTP-dependent riboflavin kinase